MTPPKSPYTPPSNVPFVYGAGQKKVYQIKRFKQVMKLGKKRKNPKDVVWKLYFPAQMVSVADVRRNAWRDFLLTKESELSFNYEMKHAFIIEARLGLQSTLSHLTSRL